MTYTESMRTGNTSESGTVTAGLGLHTVYTKDLSGLTDSDKQRLLACVNYGQKQQLPAGSAVAVNVHMEQLGGHDFHELWFSASPVHSGKSGNITYRANDEVLFGYWQPSTQEIDLKSDSVNAYNELRKFLSSSSHPNLLRVWNYMSSINDEYDGIERYQRFCLGRYDALLQDGEFEETGLPAASALGSDSGGLTLYFISTRHPGVAVENPRQVSAYHYPEQYGPRSPSFSRAMMIGGADSANLFISGTASIKGHETCYAGDVRGQLQETVMNINTLIKQSGCGPGDISALSLLKVYMRNASDYTLVHNMLSDIAPDVPTMYLRADICRVDLLLEIEGLYLSSN